MATPAQIEANRRNARKSTGPTSAAGKAVSRFNALKSGIHAESQVIPGEDPAELEALAANYCEQFQPATPLEVFLVDAIVTADWQLRRLRKLEARLWEREFSAPEEIPGPALTRLHRRIDAAERSYYRALKELQAQIAARPEVEEPDAAPAIVTDRSQFAAAGHSAPVAACAATAIGHALSSADSAMGQPPSPANPVAPALSRSATAIALAQGESAAL
jgi:hypothetical protein